MDESSSSFYFLATFVRFNLKKVAELGGVVRRGENVMTARTFLILVLLKAVFYLPAISWWALLHEKGKILSPLSFWTITRLGPFAVQLGKAKFHKHTKIFSVLFFRERGNFNIFVVYTYNGHKYRYSCRTITASGTTKYKVLFMEIKSQINGYDTQKCGALVVKPEPLYPLSLLSVPFKSHRERKIYIKNLKSLQYITKNSCSGDIQTVCARQQY